MTNDFIIGCLKRQAPECNYDLLKVEEIKNEHAAFVVFDYTDPDNGDARLDTAAAVVYEEGVCLTINDWQGHEWPESVDEIENFRWRDFEHEINGLMVGGLPRLPFWTPELEEVPAPVTRMLYPTKAAAIAALKESGKEGYKSAADGSSNLDLADGFPPDFSWSGEVSAIRTDDGDIFAWWEE